MLKQCDRPAGERELEGQLLGSRETEHSFLVCTCWGGGGGGGVLTKQNVLVPAILNQDSTGNRRGAAQDGSDLHQGLILWQQSIQGL